MGLLWFAFAILAAVFVAAYIHLQEITRIIMTNQEQYNADIQAIKDAQTAEVKARLAAEAREAALIAKIQAQVDAGIGFTHADLQGILESVKTEAAALDATDKENPPVTGGTPTEQPEG